MDKRNIITLAVCLAAAGIQAQTLKETVGDYFLIGAAMNEWQVDGTEPQAADIVRTHFNSVVAENCMKPESIEPEEGKYDFTKADKFVKWGEDNGMKVIGHVLVWHSQTAGWMFKDENGNLPGRDVMIARMRDYIYTVVGRYKGRVMGWDVVNEAFLDNGKLRESPWYNAIGPDFIELAFKFAHEADPDAELYYNDYSMAFPQKRDGVLAYVRRLQKAGCRIDAVGMQSHNGLDYPDITEYENTIKAIIDAGLKVQVTELDINVLPNPDGFGGAEISQDFSYSKKINPYADGMTKKAQKELEERYKNFFALYKKYAGHFNRVTLWGVADGSSWLNDWPVKGRTNYPLLFDRDYKAKPVVAEIAKMYNKKHD